MSDPVDDGVPGLGLSAWRASGGGRHPLVVEIERLRGELDTATARADGVQLALANSRQIGMAIGILMHQCKLGIDEAFTLLKQVSHDKNLKISHLAADVVYTGVLDTAS